MSLNTWVARLTGNVEFDEDEEYQAFRYRFLFVIAATGAMFSGLLAWLGFAGVNPLHPTFLISVTSHALGAALLVLLLRGHKERFNVVAWAYAALTFVHFLFAANFVTTDEFRLVWFVVNLAGFYIILGRLVGACVTVLSVVAVTLLNGHLAQPFSPNAMTTFYFAMIYSAVFFHVYSDRSVSFYQRLVYANAKLRVLSERDPLTGLFNARTYYALCDKLIRGAQRSGQPYSVLFVDLDHFKSINDTYGHEAGDAVLKSVANCLAEGSRGSDVVGRIGGEEFSIFLPDTDLAGAQQLAEKLRQNIEALMPSVGEQRLRVTSSIGVAMCRQQQQSIAEVQREADQAMYRAKAAGRNRVTCLG